MLKGGGESLKGGQDWGQLFHHVLDGVKAAMAEHEVAVLLQCSRLVNRHWCEWATQAVTHLDLTVGQCLKEKVRGVVDAFGTVESITLRGRVGLDLSPLQKAPLLKRLKVDGNFDDVDYGSFTNLVDLELQLEPHIYGTIPVSVSLGPQGAHALATLTRLQRLSLPFCQMSGDECVAILTVLPALSELNLKLASVSDVGIRHLAGMPKLVKCAVLLDAIGVEKMKVWRALGALTNLLALEIHENYTESGDGACAASLRALTKLTSLGLSNTASKGYQALTCLTAISRLTLMGSCVLTEGLKSLQQFPALSSLVVYCPYPGWAKWIGALSSLVELNVLGLAHPFLYTVDDLEPLAGLTSLTSLIIDHTLGLGRSFWEQHLGMTDKAPFFCAMTSLKKLHLVCSPETPYTNIAVYLSPMMNLMDLELYLCTGITDLNMEKLAVLSSLTLLSLDGADRITDRGVGELTKLTALAVLSLRRCTNVTDDGVMQLAPLRFLRRLDLHGCPKVKMDLVPFLRKWE